jgi:hypothetical protein
LSGRRRFRSCGPRSKRPRKRRRQHSSSSSCSNGSQHAALRMSCSSGCTHSTVAHRCLPVQLELCSGLRLHWPPLQLNLQPRCLLCKPQLDSFRSPEVCL